MDGLTSWPWLTACWIALGVAIPFIAGARRETASLVYCLLAPFAGWGLAHLILGASNWAGYDLGLVYLVTAPLASWAGSRLHRLLRPGMPEEPAAGG